MGVQKQSAKLEFLLTLSRYLVVKKTKNKNPYSCFFNFVRSLRDKKDVKICLANRGDKVAPNIKLKTSISYFVLPLSQGMASPTYHAEDVKEKNIR